MIIRPKVVGEFFLNRWMPQFDTIVSALSSFQVSSTYSSLSDSRPGAISPCRCCDIPDPDQVVRRNRKSEHPSASVEPFVARLSHEPYCFNPTEDLLDQ